MIQTTPVPFTDTCQREKSAALCYTPRRSKPVNPVVLWYLPQVSNSDLFARRLYSNEKYILFEV